MFAARRPLAKRCPFGLLRIRPRAWKKQIICHGWEVVFGSCVRGAA
jgi:hypothetical protein